VLAYPFFGSTRLYNPVGKILGAVLSTFDGSSSNKHGQMLAQKFAFRKIDLAFPGTTFENRNVYLIDVPLLRYF